MLERYLADLAAAMAGRREHAHPDRAAERRSCSAVRRHQWDASLPAAAAIFPEDYPPPAPSRCPRALAGHVMAQVEDPANLGTEDNPAYRLITLILIRCGLRISAAAALPADCVVSDADGAPYLRYCNTKMKREALVPVDEELEALITPAAGAQPGTLARRDPGAVPPAQRQHRRHPPDRLQHLPGRALPVAGTTATSATSTASRSHLTPHQWRHTLGTRLINRDVPQHVVQKILDHDSPK